MIWNRCVLVKDVAVKVGRWKFHMGKIEVRSSKSEVGSRASRSRLSFFSFRPSHRSHIVTRLRTWGEEEDGEEEGERDGIKLTFCNWNLLTFKKFDLELQTSSFDFEFRLRNWKLNICLVVPSFHKFSYMHPNWCFFLFVFLCFLFLDIFFLKRAISYFDLRLRTPK